MKTFLCACRQLAVCWQQRQRDKRTGATAARVGAHGVGVTELAPTGFVTIAGELWAATAVGGRLAPGAPVVIVGVNGVRLAVAALVRDQAHAS